MAKVGERQAYLERMYKVPTSSVSHELTSTYPQSQRMIDFSGHDRPLLQIHIDLHHIHRAPSW